MTKADYHEWPIIKKTRETFFAIISFHKWPIFLQMLGTCALGLVFAGIGERLGTWRTKQETLETDGQFQIVEMSSKNLIHTIKLQENEVAQYTIIFQSADDKKQSKSSLDIIATGRNEEHHTFHHFPLPLKDIYWKPPPCHRIVMELENPDSKTRVKVFLFKHK